jgi:hypothetical protein
MQTNGAPEWQVPPPQVSPVVQALTSSQGTVLLARMQPVVGLQLSSVQGLPSSQLGGAPPLQVPLSQVSLVVQTFPSSHGFALFVKTQPVAGLQLSSVQLLRSSQIVGAPLRQLPPLQVSRVVQGLPSSHEAWLLVWMQPTAGSQTSSVHGLLS